VQVGGGDDLAQCLFHIKITLAISMSGMGDRTKNFSTEQVARAGDAAAAERVLQFFPAGQRGEATEAVPDTLADEIRSALRSAGAHPRTPGGWRAIPLATPVVMTPDPTVLRLLAEATSRG
jgi:hypothetical protein